MATAAVVAGLLGVIVFPALSFVVGSSADDPGLLGTVPIVLGLIASVYAIVAGAVARGRIARDPAVGGRGAATTGLVLGIVGALWTLFLLIFVLTGGQLY